MNPLEGGSEVKLILTFLVVLVSVTTRSADGQSLLTNPNFDTNLDGWTFSGVGSADWNPADVDGSGSSGSVRWSASDSTGAQAIWQTVVSVPGDHEVSVYIYVPSGQIVPPQPKIQMSSYTTPDCAAGTREGFVTSQPATTFDSWVLVTISEHWFPTANCVAIDLQLDAPSGSESVAYFDAVSLITPIVFMNGFESGDTTAWSATVP
jgi:hypothetical protein